MNNDEWWKKGKGGRKKKKKEKYPFYPRITIYPIPKLSFKLENEVLTSKIYGSGSRRVKGATLYSDDSIKQSRRVNVLLFLENYVK